MSESPLAFIVDDEPAMLDIVSFALETQGFRWEGFRSAEGAWQALARTRPDLFVLDVMLPGMSGIALCTRIRATTDIPVMLVTAKGESADRIAGLEADADDYVVKPFHPRELALRAQRLVRRQHSHTLAKTAFGVLRLDPGGVEAVLAGERIPLTGNEYKVLAALIADANQTIDFRALLIAGWGDGDRLAGREMIKTTVYRLRNRFDDAIADSGRIIESVRGIGYMLRAELAAS